ncbi:hypothetical protein T35B1_16676 [Salinisphaera shabanensis T35B1]|uniref:pilin n=1 Tax=Salinisphaera shabanensis TaxID=180542 RepID=UPI0033402535
MSFSLVYPAERTRFAYADQRHDVCGFWASLHELLGDYPWTCKRVHAIQSLALGHEPAQPARNPFAYVLAFFAPRIPGAGAAGLIIMFAVVGVLLAVAVPAYQVYVARAEIATFLVATEADKQAVDDYAIQTQHWPLDLGEIGITDAQRTLGQMDTSVTLGEEGVLRYTFEGGSFDGKHLMFVPEPQFEGERVSGFRWHCRSTDIAAVK